MFYRLHEIKEIPVKTESGKREVVLGAIRSVDPKLHFFRIKQSWCWDKHIFEDLVKLGVKLLLLKNKKTGKIYYTFIDKVKDKLEYFNWKGKEQVAIHKDYFKTINPKGTAQKKKSRKAL